MQLIQWFTSRHFIYDWIVIPELWSLIGWFVRNQNFSHESMVDQFEILISTCCMFMFVGAYKNMLIVLVYVDGEVQHGSMGVEYSVPPKVTFSAYGKTGGDPK